MPKTSKRAATKRAARIAKAHATELPKLQVQAPTRSIPGQKRPARGPARYPWLITLTLLVIAGVVYTMYFYQVGPFSKPKPPAAHVQPTPDLRLPATSPCLNLAKQLTYTGTAPDKTTFAKIPHTYANAPIMSIDTHRFYCAGINTTKGLIIVELDPQYAPNTVNNFVFLAKNRFYDGLTFHRVVPGFIIQGGDPKGNGTGGPGYKFNDEKVLGKYTQGCMAMANSGPNTNGSQFFICTADDTSKLQNSYNLFGRVVQGMDVAQKIQGPNPDDPKTKNIVPDVITHIVIIEAPA